MRKTALVSKKQNQIKNINHHKQLVDIKLRKTHFNYRNTSNMLLKLFFSAYGHFYKLLYRDFEIYAQYIFVRKKGIMRAL